EPTLEGLQKEKISYNGLLCFGLMNCNGEPYVLEYNCRMGDPEAQAILPRLKTDLVSLLRALAAKGLKEYQLEVAPEHTASVVAVAQGYPGLYAKNKAVHIQDKVPNTHVFHAGITQDGARLLTSGGRVLSVTGWG